MPALWTETYKIEFLAQQNNIKTSNYVQRMMEHYFPLRCQSIQTQLLVLALRSNPGVQMGLFQRNDVTAVPRAHMSDVSFSKFQFQSTFCEW